MTADLLSPDLRKMWKKEMAGACPDFVGGRFTGPAEEYTVNLIKRVDGKVCEQVLLFKPVTASFAKISILPPIEVATVSVITRTPPGKYADAQETHRVMTNHDSIALTAPEKGTVLYYWTGGRFHSLVTSE